MLAQPLRRVERILLLSEKHIAQFAGPADLVVHHGLRNSVQGLDTWIPILFLPASRLSGDDGRRGVQRRGDPTGDQTALGRMN